MDEKVPEVWDLGDVSKLWQHRPKKKERTPIEAWKRKQRTDAVAAAIFWLFLLAMVIGGFLGFLYFAGGTPWWYPHALVHGEEPTGDPIQFKVVDTQHKPLAGVPIMIRALDGGKQLSTDEAGFAYFGTVYWRNTMPVTLGGSYQSCTYELGPIYLGSDTIETIDMTVECP